MALLSDRDSFDRLICQRARFEREVDTFASRIRDPLMQQAVRRYALWRAYNDETLLDSCFDGIPTADWQEIIDAVNGIWADSWP